MEQKRMILTNVDIDILIEAVEYYLEEAEIVDNNFYTETCKLLNKAYIEVRKRNKAMD